MAPRSTSAPSWDGLTDVDLDCLEAVRLAPHFLPPTGSIYGRPGKRRSHYLYKTNDPDEKASIKQTDENRKVLVELRMGGGGKGAQSVMAGSLHPSGELYEWDEDGVVATTTCATLKAAIAKIAAGALLARHWPEGSRHDASLRVGGFLARCGWEPDAIGDFLVAVQEVAGVQDNTHIEGGRKAAVDAANYQLETGQGYGSPAMAEMFGEDVAKQLAKLIGYYAERQMPAAARGLRWREVTKRGHPVASLFNARVAVAALGVTCRYDLFHHKIMLECGRTVHEWTGGELDDIALTRMRQFVSDQYGFDPTTAHMLDAIKTLAVEHCFDPVLEMLDQAQEAWDGEERLDRWVVDYLGCADTELNRAIGRKTLIAAVHRARVPGCKYDIITVLESPEGWNKSTAIRVLAGDENFSDQRLLGTSDKEVQEQLEGVWMHENADLAGMKRAEVEQVKTFASRQVDRARPAYGRVRENRLRRSIEWGTTNTKEYLLSQTGNRRFWPLEVDQIDIAKLKRDRLQLLGEAATYEADGEDVVLDRKLWGLATDAQEERRAKDPWEDILAEMPKAVDVYDKPREKFETRRIIYHEGNEHRVRSADLLEHVLKLSPAHQTRFDAMRLSDVMRALGWKRQAETDRRNL
jgi:hypothetical protein